MFLFKVRNKVGWREIISDAKILKLPDICKNFFHP